MGPVVDFEVAPSEPHPVRLAHEDFGQLVTQDHSSSRIQPESLWHGHLGDTAQIQEIGITGGFVIRRIPSLKNEARG